MFFGIVFGVGDRAMLEDLVRALTAVRIKPVIDRVSAFSEVKEAFRRLASGSHIGKIVVCLDGGS
jgi:NADPH:quinone reductase-like Zn-dependent oxidoreductase